MICVKTAAAASSRTCTQKCERECIAVACEIMKRWGPRLVGREKKERLKA